MIAAGARMVGGCCGTTPQHIRAMREALDRAAPEARASVEGRERLRIEIAEAPPIAATVAPTRLEQKLEARDFVVTVELDPPRGHNIQKLVRGAKLLRERAQAERLAEVGRIAARVAHEVNSPLAAVKSNVQWLGGAESMNDRAERAAVHVQRTSPSRPSRHCSTVG